MPTYEYKCRECGNIQEEIHSIKVDPVIRCNKCESVNTERLISKNIGGFVLKDDTAEKLWRVKRQQHKKNAELGVKQIERYGTSGGSRLVPNVDGKRVASWSEAKMLARDKGKNDASYDGLVQKEKHVSKQSGVDDKIYKAAKDYKNKN